MTFTIPKYWPKLVLCNRDPGMHDLECDTQYWYNLTDKKMWLKHYEGWVLI